MEKCKKLKNLTGYLCDSIPYVDTAVELEEVIHLSTANEVKNNERTIIQNSDVQKNNIREANCNDEIGDTINRKNDLINTGSDLLVLSDKVKISQSESSSTELILSSCQNHENEDIMNDQIKMNFMNEVVSNVDVKGSETINTTNHGIIVNKREELNAFHVLMPRNKSPKQLTLEEQTFTIENRQELKSRFEQSKDKLTVSLDRKRSMKRKLSEDGQGQGRIKKQLGNRSKTFEYATVKDDVKICPNALNQKIFTHGLHNYFSKVTPLDEEKTEDLETPTVIVKAGIHRTKVITSLKLLESKTNDKNVESKVRKVLNTVDDVGIFQCETSNLLPTQTTALEQTKEKPQYQDKKSKWSMRINFHTRDTECDTIDGDILDKEKKLLKNSTKSKQKGMHKSCANKKSQKQKNTAEIDEDINVDVSDLENKSYKKDLQTNTDNEIIVLKDEKGLFNEKFAPLFMKRSKPDSTVLAARQRLPLYPKSSESWKNELESKSCILVISTLPFPTVSHVTQLNDNTKLDESWDYIKYRGKEVYAAHLDPTDLKCVNNYIDITAKDSISMDIDASGSIETILQEIEKRCVDAREIWRTISTITNKFSRRLSPKKIIPKHKLTDKKMNPGGNRNGVHADTWTQKYRPLSAKEVTGNEEAAVKLRNWLKTWRLSTREDNYSSSDEFYGSDNSYDSLSKNKQVAILLGPHGCGKTASVYAIAEELGYTVLEVNASSKRSGRIIIRELEEATKSHRVKKLDSKTITQHMLSRKTNISERSLILVEDVDLIFDEDEGFVSAIYQLASNTKCPIAMTCRYSCSHLNRLAPQQLQIYFRAISGSRVMAFIELIALAETGSSISHLYLEKLIAGGDLRKALLNLQYLLQSETPRAIGRSSIFQKTWPDMCNYYYNPIVEMNMRRIMKKNENIQVSNTAISNQIPQAASRPDLDIFNLANDLDIMSLVSSLIDINDPVFHICQVKFEPSLSLEENVNLYSHKNVQSKEICKWMQSQIIDKYIEDNDKNSTRILSQLLTQKESNKKVNLALSQVSNYTLDNRILSTDYLPIVRSICRAEDVKVNNNMKRGNRFFHYLQNLRIPSTSIKPNILKAASKIMYESTGKFPEQ